jgi:uncharacterized LabA/DUF88 family protein
MRKPLVNYAFIDHQNIHLSFQSLGWKLDWRKFRVYLEEKYGVKVAYQFLGYLPEQQNLYRGLQKKGYVLVFKTVTWRPDGKPKGNVDAELVLQAMIDYPEYERAVLVTSDGDFACLVRHLDQKGKLEAVLSPTGHHCSALLKKAAGGRLRFLDQLKRKLEHKK